MECMHCKGRMVRGTAPFSLDRNGYHVSWDAIPAWVCTQCGEPFFESREIDLIQKALTELDRESAALASRQQQSHSLPARELFFESAITLKVPLFIDP